MLRQILACLFVTTLLVLGGVATADTPVPQREEALKLLLAKKHLLKLTFQSVGQDKVVVAARLYRYGGTAELINCLRIFPRLEKLSLAYNQLTAKEINLVAT
jgi:hypothetical protein